MPDRVNTKWDSVHVSSDIGLLLLTSPCGSSRDAVVSVPSWDRLAREIYSAELSVKV